MSRRNNRLFLFQGLCSTECFLVIVWFRFMKYCNNWHKYAVKKMSVNRAACKYVRTEKKLFVIIFWVVCV
jgi:hypothetical protein